MGTRVYLTALAAALALTGCTTPGSAPKEVMRHAVDTEKMKAVMLDMNNIVFEKHVSELERDQMRLRSAKEIATLVEQIADGLKAGKETATLPPADRERVNGISGELRNHASNLREIAQKLEAEKIPPALNRMLDTCDSCHAVYRNGKHR